jgi:hypothetical protein
MHRLRKSATPIRAARADRSREERDNGCILDLEAPERFHQALLDFLK